MSHGQQRQEQMTNIVDGNKSAISLFPFFQVNLMVVRFSTYSDIHDLRPCHGRCFTCEPSLSCWQQQTNSIPSQSSLNYSEPCGHSRHEARPRPSTKMADDSLTPDLSSPGLPPRQPASSGEEAGL